MGAGWDRLICLVMSIGGLAVRFNVFLPPFLPVRKGANADVSGQYTATSNKLATSFTNGAVVLWDLGKEGGSHLGTFTPLYSLLAPLSPLSS